LDAFKCVLFSVIGTKGKNKNKKTKLQPLRRATTQKKKE
jgi:hypothetical protein